MKKSKLFVWLLALVLAFATFGFAGCKDVEDVQKDGDNDNNTTPPSNEPTQTEINQTALSAVVGAAVPLLSAGVNFDFNFSVSEGEIKTVEITDAKFILKSDALTMATDAYFKAAFAAAGMEKQTFALTLKSGVLYIESAGTKLQVQDASFITLLGALLSLSQTGEVSPILLAANLPPAQDELDLTQFVGNCTYAEKDGVASIGLPIVLGKIDATFGDAVLNLSIELNFTAVSEVKLYTFKNVSVNQKAGDVSVQASFAFTAEPAVVNVPQDESQYKDLTNFIYGLANTAILPYYELDGRVTYKQLSEPLSTNYNMQVQNTLGKTEAYVKAQGYAYRAGINIEEVHETWFDGADMFYFAMRDADQTEAERIKTKANATFVAANAQTSILSDILLVPGLNAIIKYLPDGITLPAVDLSYDKLKGTFKNMTYNVTDTEAVFTVSVDLNPLFGSLLPSSILKFAQTTITVKVTKANDGNFYLTEVSVTDLGITGVAVYDLSFTLSPLATVPAGGVLASLGNTADYANVEEPIPAPVFKKMAA